MKSPLLIEGRLPPAVSTADNIFDTRIGTKNPAVDTAGFVGYSKYKTDYLSAAANNGTIIQSTRIPAINVAISFCVFLLNMNIPPLFHERY